ncbi:VOC family protein [Nocardioides marmoriginsengisoli]|uniref:VOC family protein n=1 Tax=Nocardioides marmoriginsengisoli TaxID=661483 RepID=A0A3N0CIJ8_9ACTN|nr:VOC family protein [Nocardioides marmoriginsengisoli]RNL63255.1 VOC family protein [Nocardioides marmoriginsengisoli]
MTATIATGPVTQIAWVTDDIAATEAFLSTAFGAGTWTRMNDIRFAPEDCTLRGEPADFVIHVSIVYVGDLQLEVIQPVSGTSIYSEFLAEKGPGLHHLCFDVEDMEAALAAAAELGHPVHQAGSMMAGGMDFAYIDGTAHGVPYVEIARIGPEMKAIFEAIKAQS